MMLSLIVASAQNGVIGKNNDLPWHIPADLKRFKALTVGKPVIMGRKTFDSIFSRLKKPLPDRHNIVISRSGFFHPGVTSCESIDAAIAEAGGADEIMVIGGGSVFEETLPRADKIYLTLIERDYEGDSSFPPLASGEWKLTEDEYFDGNPAYRFQTLVRA